MNYIAEINAFERWLETNHLPNLSQLLWYKLIMLNNRAGWAEWIQVDNQKLMALIQVESKNTFIRARDRLVESGAVFFKKGRKGYPNRYKLRSFCICGSKFEPQMEPQTEPQTTPYVEPQTEPQTGHIYKLNKTKQKEKDILKDIQKEPEWLGFVEMRKRIKSPLTGRAEKLALDKLEKLAPDDIEKQKAILDASTLHDWKGLFPLEEEQNGIPDRNAAKGCAGQNAGASAKPPPKYGNVL